MEGRTLLGRNPVADQRVPSHRVFGKASNRRRTSSGTGFSYSRRTFLHRAWKSRSVVTNRRRTVVHRQSDVERIIDIVPKRPRELERPLQGRAARSEVANPAMLEEILERPVRLRSINPPAIRQNPSSSKGQLVRHEQPVLACQTRGDDPVHIRMPGVVLDQKDGQDGQVDQLTRHPRTRPPPASGRPPFPTFDRLLPCTASGRWASGGFPPVRRPRRVGPPRSGRVPPAALWGSGLGPSCPG